jgi:diguanylate cyclase (GGDEF)-like protein/PAS domain S-box-containing protein
MPTSAPGTDLAVPQDAAELDFAGLWDAAPCGLLLTGAGGLVSTVNTTFLAWSGWTRDQVVGMPFQRLLPVGDQILWSTHCLPQLTISGAVSEMAVEVKTPAGERRAALVSAARVPGNDGPAQTRIVVFSAHERRKYELELVAARRRAEESEARRASAEADLHHLALHDPLTGLRNRAGLMAAVQQFWSRAGEREDRVAALFIDLDHFKAVNDSLGHAAGDALLQTVAGRLQATARATAVVARLAGDEFVVVELGVTPGDLAAWAERVLTALQAPLVLEGLEVVVTASIGAAVQTSGHEPFEDLLRHADGAMYSAKARGRSGWLVHDPGQPDATTNRLRLLGELRQGIERGELRLHFQPRLGVASQQVVGAEALVRWQHPTQGLLPPDTFIDLAESSGLVRELGGWVLDAAVAQARSWQEPGHPLYGVDVAVNLSARQLADPQLLSRVTGALDRHGLHAARLVLEITETALMLDPAAALETLRALAALGVALAIDDFGTGYSSFTYLKTFPVDEVKIDRSFVAGLCTDPGDRAIVASCIQLARAMGARSVAEGVEDADQLRELVALGCDQAQGFLWARGLDAETLTSWVARRSPALSAAGS